MSSRPLLWLYCAALLAAAGDRAVALEMLAVTTVGPNHLVLKTEGRKGTRVYTPDDLADYKALVEAKRRSPRPMMQARKISSSGAWRAGIAQLTSPSGIGEKSASGNFRTEVCDGPVAT
jgi:hypothetical protein